MITSTNIYKLHDVWRYTEKTINAIVQIAKDNHDWIDGFSIDIEPEHREEPTHDDTIKYANFVNVLAKSLHAIGVNLTVCIANWSPLFDGNFLKLTEVDRFIQMSTYTANLPRFEEIVNESLDFYGTKQLAIGLQQLNSYSASDLQKRLDYLRFKNITMFGLWATPIRENWIPLLDAFVNDELSFITSQSPHFLSTIYTVMIFSNFLHLTYAQLFFAQSFTGFTLHVIVMMWFFHLHFPNSHLKNSF